MQAGSRLKVKIGLEVHCQLTSLKTKLFCTCSADYRSSEPNEKICPVCFGLPGTLPVLNAKAVEYAAMIALALNCDVASRSVFYRKNYFYPDLPKGFQISQYDKAGGVAIAASGHVDIEGKRVRIRRIQLEEDPGKLTYEGTIEKSTHSLVDYNRAGIALVEIVTEPDMRDAKEAKAFLEKLRSTVESLGVSNGELEGAMRCDANVSLEGGARVEVKNISSFKEVEKALNYEILRQRTFSGNAQSETRHWDERRGITIALRSKEEEQDYRYFPEPDLPPIVLKEAGLERIRHEMPEVAEAKVARYVRDFELPAQLATELAQAKALTAFFEECSKEYTNYHGLATFIMSEFGVKEPGLPPQRLVELMKLVDDGSISRVQAKSVLKEMMESGKTAREVVKARGLSVVVDEAAIKGLVDKAISEMPQMANQAKADPKVFSYMVGQILRMEPRAEPKMVAKKLAERIK